MPNHRYVSAAFCALASVVLGCGAGGASPAAPRFGTAEHLGFIETQHLDELSGLEPSFHEPGLFWAHNDHKPVLYAIDSSGKHIASVDVADTPNADWEDISSFRLEGESFLLIADTGGNKKKRTDYRLICVKEPQRDSESDKFSKQVEPAWTVEFRYRDRNERVDCEAIAVDVSSRTILLLTKEESDGDASQLYGLPLADESAKGATATLLGTVRSIVTATSGDPDSRSKPTAMDVCDDGNMAVVLTSRHAYAFVRGPGDDWRDVFSSRPTLISLPRLVQAEALCFDHLCESLIVSSERGDQIPHAPVIRVPLIDR